MRSVLVAVLIAGVGLTLTTLGWRSSVAANERALETRFSNQATDLSESIQREFNGALQTVTILRLISIDRADRTPELEEFRAVAGTMLQSRGGSIQALEWIPRVAAAERRSFEQETADQLGTDFVITSRNDDGELVSAADSDFYYPVTFVVPAVGNEAALGFDLGSHPARRRSLETARDSGRATATGPIRLVQEQTADQYGVLVFEPVYRGDLPPTLVEARRERLVGFTLGVFRIVDLVEHAVQGLAPSSTIAIEIVDLSAPAGQQTAFVRSAGFVGDTELRSQAQLNVAGNDWRITLVATEEFGSPHSPLTWSILLVGLSVTGLGAASGVAVVWRTGRDREVIARRTRQLEASDERYQGLFEGTTEVIQSVWPDGSFAYVNPAWLERFGYRADELSDVTFRDIVHPDSLAHCETLFAAAMATGESQPMAAAFVTRSGERVELEGSIDTLREGGEIVQTRTILHDVTIQRRMLNELVELADTREKFLATMSHELRTPLNGVLGFAELMELSEAEPLTERQRSHVQRIISSGRHLLSLIDDLLDVAKVDAGEFVLDREPLDPREMIEEVAANLRPGAEARGLELLVSFGDLPDRFQVDRRSLRQVLLNLVGNAIKFTDQGTVEVHAHTVEDNLSIEVRDTGIGIAAADTERIFEEFAQVDAGDARRRMGAGLGLAISTRLVELHGGTITVQSVVGSGSTFTVTFPLDHPSTNDAAQPVGVVESGDG